MTRKSAAKPTRALLGRPADPEKCWRREIWTREQAQRVWPTWSQLLIYPKKMRTSANVHTFVRAMAQFNAAAYECLRWARWAEEDEVYVRCPDCNERAWSHGVRRDERRWRCVTKAMYEAHQKAKDYQVGAHSRNGCGGKFYDTKGTPFDTMQAPLGLVFFALYFPAEYIDQSLRVNKLHAQADELSTVLTTLKEPQHAELAVSLRHLAKVFCGTLFLEYQPIMVSEAGRILLQTNIAADDAARAARRAKIQGWKKVISTEYEAIRADVDRLERMDKAQAQRPAASARERTGRYRGLMGTMRRIASAAWFDSDPPSRGR